MRPVLNKHKYEIKEYTKEYDLPTKHEIGIGKD